jgi:protein phosphatase
MLEVLAGALHKANDRIADLVEADYSLEGMGTTVTGVLFDGTQFGLAHIGDSRAYLLHESRLERLTHDHSWVQSLVDDGKISENEAAVHPHRSLLLKVLNGQPANDPDLTMVKVVPGDRLLLCSDGLCGLVDDPVIEEALRLPDLDDALRRLVDEALAEGGIDNITVILADVVESGATEGAVVLGAASELAIPPVETRSRTGASQPDEDDDPDELVDAEGGENTVTITRSGAGAAALAAGGTPDDLGDDEERYRPQPPRQRRLGRPLVTLLVLALVVGAGLASAYAWTRTQFYVGAAADNVAIFQGLSQSVPGLSLSQLYEVQPLAVSALPPYYQERVRANIDVAGLNAARETVSQLTDAAKRCAIVSPGRPSASGAASPVPAPTSPQPSVAATTNVVTPRPSGPASAPTVTPPRPSTPNPSEPTC